MVLREGLEDVEVAADEVVLGDDARGVGEFSEDGEAAAGKLELAFDGLIAVGDAGEGDGVGLVAGVHEGGAEELGGVVLDEDFGFEVEAGGEAEVFVGGAGVALPPPTRCSLVKSAFNMPLSSV